MIAFFKKPYRVMRYSEQTVVNGYQTSGYTEIEPVMLDVQEMSNNMNKEEHGKRASKTVQAFGQFDFRAAEYPDIKGDRLLYRDQWYECTSCLYRHNTVLSHYHATFTLVPDGGKADEF